MNAVNAPNATNANKRTIWRTAALVVALAVTTPAMGATTTSGAAPSLYGVTDVAIGPITFVEPKLATACNLAREELRLALKRALTGSPGLMLLAGEDIATPHGAHVTLTPLILTSRTETDCVSWIRLEALNAFPVVIPPVQVPRLMTLRLWDQSRTVTSTPEKHQRLTLDALESLGHDFGRAVMLAQPGKMPDQITDQQKQLQKQEELMRTLDDSVRQKLLDHQPVERLLPEIEAPTTPDKTAKPSSSTRKFDDMPFGGSYNNPPESSPTLPATKP